MVLQKSTLIFGCGNTLLGDDGFGPAVVERLQAAYKDRLPPEAEALDVGTSIREILFDLILSPERPQRLIILDAVDQEGRSPGEVFEIGVDDLPAVKVHDFSLHQFPTVNMLKELKEHTRMEVRILVVQVKEIPEEVRPGLSPPVARAVDRACLSVLEMI
jgi:coenzyme F420 hydrogenase subunit delta